MHEKPTYKELEQKILALEDENAALRQAKEQLRKEETRTNLLLELHLKAPALSDRELYDYVLEKAVDITGSTVGFFHRIDKTWKNIELTAWTADTLKNCQVDLPDHYPIQDAGNWVDCLKKKEPLIYNDFSNSPNQKGLPKGHVPIKRMMSFPVSEDDKIHFIFGVGNKKTDYTLMDVVQTQLIADELGKIMHQREIGQAFTLSENRYRTMMETMKDLSYICSPDFLIEYMNPAMIKRTGYDACGELCFEVLHGRDEKCPWCMYDQVQEGRYCEQEIVSPFDNRSYHVSHAPIHQSDGSISKMSVFRDITKIKLTQKNLSQSEKKYKDLFESITDLIYTQDLQGRFTSVNPAMNKLFGYDMDEFIGHQAVDFMPAGTGEFFHREYLEDLKNKGGHKGTANYLRKDGKTIYIEHRSVLVRPEEGEPYISGIGRDVTERITSEKEVEKLQKQLIHSQKIESIGTLAGGIAHDFNNILFPILGHLEIILTDLPKSQLRTTLEQVFKNAERARELVKQILIFSRQTEHELSPLQSHLVIKEALKLIKSSFPSTIKMIQNIQKDCDMILADPTHLHQIVMNLCINALHAMEDTGGKLTVRLKQVELTPESIENQHTTPGEYVCLTVSDTGMGMEKSIVDRIFDPYFTTKDKEKGTGLGLAVIHGIVTSYKGYITVDSETGKGTTISIYLPVAKHEKKMEKSETRIPLDTGNEHVLLVDDEDLIVQIEKKMLTRLGYRVTTRYSSTDALEAFKANPDTYDAVITDMTMPNMTGDILAKELMAIRPDVPIVICTGYSEKLDRESASKIGIIGYLLKPVVISELAHTLRKALDMARESPLGQAEQPLPPVTE